MIALIKAIHNFLGTSAASNDEAKGLSAVLRLCVVRIILRQNLWTSEGLVNGSAGRITDIIYDPIVEYENYNHYVPLCLFVHFHKCTVPTLHERSIPIIAVTSPLKEME